MSKHTAGPLTLTKCRCGDVICDQHLLSNQRTSGFEEADAQRLIACWNACEGIDPEGLELLLKSARQIVHREDGVDLNRALCNLRFALNITQPQKEEKE